MQYVLRKHLFIKLQAISALPSTGHRRIPECVYKSSYCFPFFVTFSVQMPANWEATTAVVTVPKMLDMDINTRRKTAQEYVLGPPGCSLASRIAQFNGTAYF